MTTRTRSGLIFALGTALLVSACSSSSSTPASNPSTPTRSATTGSATTSAPATSAVSSAAPSGSAGAKQIYVSVGDSYAAGYQPTSAKSGSTTRNGFAYQVVTDAKAKGYDFTLANFGCAGATTSSVLKAKGCDAKKLGPGADPYDGKTQAAAAEEYLRAHQADVGLVTVSIGGNDVVACAQTANPVPCVSTAIMTVKTNLETLVKGLREAAGPKVQIVGITYPDVLLGNLLSKKPAVQSTGRLSVTAFQALINPALQSTYASVGGKFVDVTKATGGFGPLTDMTTLAPYGKIPVPVAKICTLTYYCQYGDIHPHTNGYAIIAKLIVATLPKR